jgi:hypothetical protein
MSKEFFNNKKLEIGFEKSPVTRRTELVKVTNARGRKLLFEASSELVLVTNIKVALSTTSEPSCPSRQVDGNRHQAVGPRLIVRRTRLGHYFSTESLPEE